MFRIGIDLGGTKTEAILLDPNGQEIKRHRVPTPKTYRQIIENIADMVHALDVMAEEKASVGVGIPGSLSPRTGLVRGASTVVLNGHAIDRDLGLLLGRQVRATNDANCLAASEATDGAGAPYAVVFAAILGTGCGSGITIEGNPLVGTNGIAGEWGHTPLPRMNQDEWPGDLCFCGQRGCKEQFISGTGFCDDYEKATGERLKGEEIVAKALANNTAAQATLDRYCDRLARALSDIVNVLDPDIIVLGGGMSNVDALYQRVPPLLSAYCFAEDITTPIVKAKHGDSSGVRGAAWLWSKNEA